jgi:hypothetical protein
VTTKIALDPYMFRRVPLTDLPALVADLPPRVTAHDALATGRAWLSRRTSPASGERGRGGSLRLACAAGIL